MKRAAVVLGFVGLSVLAVACSGRDEEPVPFAASRDVAAELLAHYGAPFAVEYAGRNAFWASPLADTRALANSAQEAEAAALDLVQRFGRDFGAGDEPAHVKITRVERDETGGFTVRFTQLITGTDIEILETGGALDLASDGTLRSASAALVPSAGFPKVARVAVSDVDAIVRKPFPTGDFTVVEKPVLLARRAPNGGATLVYRTTFTVDGTGYEAWVDANDPNQIELGQPRAGADGEDTTTRAWPFAAYPLLTGNAANLEKYGVEIAVTQTGGQYSLVQLPTAERSRIHTVEQTGEGRVGEPSKWDWIVSSDPHQFRGNFPIHTPIFEGILPYFAPAAVDVHHNTALVDAAFRRVVHEGPIRDGVLAAITHSNSRVVRTATKDSDGTMTWKDVVDSKNPRFNASFEPISNRVLFGDGGFRDGTYMFPIGTALDVVGHEWTHAFMSRKTGLLLVGEDGAIQETVSDAVGKVIAIRNGDAVEDTIGAKLFFATGALRSFANPSAYSAPSESIGADGGSSAVTAKIPAKVDILDVECMKSLKVDQGCVHLNAGPGNHAFYLMKQGLKQVSPAARVDGKDVKPWLDQLEAIWFYSAGHAVRAPRETTGGSYAALALQQVDYARKWGMARQKQVACAWFNVGALKGQALSERGMICPVADSTERTSAPSDCSGKADGFYCNESSPFSATQCKSGAIAGGAQCAGGLECVVLDPRTRAAKLTESGTITCEPKP